VSRGPSAIAEFLVIGLHFITHLYRQIEKKLFGNDLVGRLVKYLIKCNYYVVKYKGSPYSITERRVPELILVLGSQPAGDVSHKPGGRLQLLCARPAVTPATLKRAAANFAAW